MSYVVIDTAFDISSECWRVVSSVSHLDNRSFRSHLRGNQWMAYAISSACFMQKKMIFIFPSLSEQIHSTKSLNWLNIQYTWLLSRIQDGKADQTYPRWTDVSDQYLNSLFRGFAISFGRDFRSRPSQIHNNNLINQSTNHLVFNRA